MSWGTIGTIVTFILEWWMKRSINKGQAEKQLAKLSDQMDKMTKKHAKLKIKYDKIEQMLKDLDNESHVEEQ